MDRTRQQLQDMREKLGELSADAESPGVKSALTDLAQQLQTLLQSEAESAGDGAALTPTNGDGRSTPT